MWGIEFLVLLQNWESMCMAGRGSPCGKEGTVFLHLISPHLAQDYSSSETCFLGKCPITMELQGFIRGTALCSSCWSCPFLYKRSEGLSFIQRREEAVTSCIHLTWHFQQGSDSSCWNQYSRPLHRLEQHLTDMQAVLPPPLNTALLDGLVSFCDEGIACPNFFRQRKN